MFFIIIADTAHVTDNMLITIISPMPFFLCESLYQINYRAVEALVNGINAAIDSDMKYIKNSTSGMY